MLGVLLVDKPHGISPHDAVNSVRRRLGTRRVGHAGTLDPLATGLLVVAVGPATRFLQYLPLEPKVYEAKIVFGETRTTFDAEGETTATAPIPDRLTDSIEEALPHFLGLISQVPPMYSAVKVQGKALYHYARKGEEVHREPRTVHIQSLDVSEVQDGTARLRVVCSGGTYIRSLANDLGEAMGCGAYLGGLRRTQVGRFDLAGAVPLTEIGSESIIPLAEALPPMPLVTLSDLDVAKVREGRAIHLASPPEGPLCSLLDPHGNAFSVARVSGNMAQPECVIPAEVIDEAI